jgi:hypothetical protein
VTETRRRARGGANRQGRERRRRRTEAGVEARDEARRERVGESRRGNAASGSGFPELGAPEGRQTSREDGRDEGTVVVHRTGSADGEAAEVLEGECKARSGIQVDRATDRPATRRNTPGSNPQGKRAQVEPQSQTSGYDAWSHAEGRYNTAEGRAATDRGSEGGDASAASPERTRHRAISDRGSRYSEEEDGD